MDDYTDEYGNPMGMGEGLAKEFVVGFVKFWEKKLERMAELSRMISIISIDHTNWKRYDQQLRNMIDELDVTIKEARRFQDPLSMLIPPEHLEEYLSENEKLMNKAKYALVMAREMKID
jgi:hypothetical protein